jgi:hypothetical protein
LFSPKYQEFHPFQKENAIMLSSGKTCSLLSLIPCLLLSSILIQSCTSKQTPDDMNLSEFHKTYINSQPKVANSSESLRIYIDYSSGMYEAVTATMDFLKDVYSIASGRSQYFRVGKPDIPILIDNIDAPNSTPWNIANYNDPRSVLDKPIEMIVNDTEHTSVYITDFELVKSPRVLIEISQNGKKFRSQVDVSPWAVNSFYDWLNRGNSIDIFANQFTRRDNWIPVPQKQYVYVIVFTPYNQILDEKSFVNRMIAKLSNNNSQSIVHFNFSAADFRLEQKYPSKDRAGQHDYLNAYEIFDHKSEGYEYYNFNPKEVTNLILDEKQVDRRILHNIFLTKYSEAYADVDLALNVYDISQQYDKFVNAKSEEQKPVKENPETGQKDTSGQTLTHYDFSLGEPVPEMFELVFNKSSNEIGVKGHKNYTKPTDGSFYLLNVIINNVTFNNDKKIAGVLSWQDARGFEVGSLYNSLREAMERIKMQNKVLYSYYLKF